MEPIDIKMAKCPLKQEIRVELWEKYIKKVIAGGRHVKYLTLFCPPLTDVKVFARNNLIALEEGVYKGVAGVTNKSRDWAEAQGELSARLECLICTDINTFLIKKKKDCDAKERQLLEMFPFDAINLDYCDSVFSGKDMRISPEFKALHGLFGKQSKADKFVLLLTTRAESGQLSEDLFGHFKDQIASNITSLSGFKEACKAAFSCETADELRQQAYPSFVPVGFLKYIAKTLKGCGYVVRDSGGAWLIRNSPTREAGTPERWLLHMAFLITRPEIDIPEDIGKVGDGGYEKYLPDIIGNYKCGKLLWVEEAKDRDVLRGKHGALLKSLVDTNFEVPTPEPKP